MQALLQQRQGFHFTTLPRDDSLTGFVEEAKELFVGPEGDDIGGTGEPYKTMALSGLHPNMRRSSNGESLQVSACEESSEETRNASISSTTLSSFGDLSKDPNIARAVMEAALESQGLLAPMEEEDEHDLDAESSSRHAPVDTNRRKGNNANAGNDSSNGIGQRRQIPLHGTHYGSSWNPIPPLGKTKATAEQKFVMPDGGSSLYDHDHDLMDATVTPPNELAAAADPLALREEAVERREPPWGMSLGPPQQPHLDQDAGAAAVAAPAVAELPSLGSLLRSPEIANSRSWTRGAGAPPLEPHGPRGDAPLDGANSWSSHLNSSNGSWEATRGMVMSNAGSAISGGSWPRDTGFTQNAASGGRPPPPVLVEPLPPPPPPVAPLQRQRSPGLMRLFGRSPSTRRNLNGGGNSSHSATDALPEVTDASAASAARASGSGSSFLRRLSSGKMFGRSLSKRSSAGVGSSEQVAGSMNLDDGSEGSRTNGGLGRYPACSASLPDGVPDDDSSLVHVHDGRGSGSSSAPPSHTHAAPAAAACLLRTPQQNQQGGLGGEYYMAGGGCNGGVGDAGMSRAGLQALRRESAPAFSTSALSINGDFPNLPGHPRPGNLPHQHFAMGGTVLGAAMWAQHQMRQQQPGEPEPVELVQLHAQERLRHMDPTTVGYLAGPQPYGIHGQSHLHVGSAPAVFCGGSRQPQEQMQQHKGGGFSSSFDVAASQMTEWAPPPLNLTMQRTAPATLGCQPQQPLFSFSQMPAEAAAAAGAGRSADNMAGTQQRESKSKRASWPSSSWRMLESLIPILGRGGGKGGGASGDASTASVSRRAAGRASDADGSQRPSLSRLGSGFAKKMKRQTSLEMSKPAKRRQRKGGDDAAASGEEDFCPRCCNEICTCIEAAAAGAPALVPALVPAVDSDSNGGGFRSASPAGVGGEASGAVVERTGFIRSRQEVAARRRREKGRFTKGPSPWVSVTQIKLRQQKGAV